MNIDKEATIEVITLEDENLSRSGRQELVSNPMSVSNLRQQFKEFMSNLQSIIEEDVETNGAFHLSEVQFSAEITTNGEFKLMGTGIGVEGKSAVTFTLNRRQ